MYSGTGETASLIIIGLVLVKMIPYHMTIVLGQI